MFSVSRVINSQAVIATGARGFHSTAAACTEVTRGVVKWFNAQKGFGFITPEDGTTDVFVHQTNIKMEGDRFRSLMDGEPVEFTMTTDPKSGKIAATNVTGPGGAPCRGRPRELRPPRTFNSGEGRPRRSPREYDN